MSMPPPPIHPTPATPSAPPVPSHPFGDDQPSPGDLANFGIRLKAALLDFVVYAPLLGLFVVAGLVVTMGSFANCGVVEGPYSTSDYVCDGGGPTTGLSLGGLALILLGGLVVFSLQVRAVARTGQTWGRRTAGIRVVDRTTGTPIGRNRAIGRLLFASFVSGQFLGIGHLWMLWDANKQTLHDKVVDSVVVKV